MARSIKKRILTNYLIAVTMIVSILGVFTWYSIREYYYKSVEYHMKDEIEAAAAFLKKYLSTVGLREASEDMMDNLLLSSNIQVQVIDENKNLILDSLGMKELDLSNDADIDNAINKDITNIVHGRLLAYSNDNVMIVTEPIRGKGTKGAIRFVTSLEKIDSTMSDVGIFITVIAVVIISIIVIVSIKISKGIIEPLLKVNDAAKRMAKGDYSVKAEKSSDDEIGNLADTLNIMSEEIVKNEKLKNEFISSISHELKTPLTSIKGWGVTLKIKEVRSEEMLNKGLDIIISESDRLTGLVNELLDFSRYEAGNITLKISDVDINEMLKEICTQLEPRCSRSGEKICYEERDLGTINADRDRMKQVFINVIDNAIKFSPKGTIKIYSKADIENIFITVEDNGCGIKAEDLPKVRQKFFKGSLETSGNGIGLALCDEIVKLHKGKMEIDSIYGQGTKVTIILKR